MKKINFSLIILVFSIPYISFAHPGRTDSSGCHTCRTNCSNWGLSTGEYHCHRSKGVSQPVDPIKSTYGESGTGYTTPAPDYKTPKIEVAKISNQTQTKSTESKSWVGRFFNWFK